MIVAMLLPIVGIVLSAASFAFAEFGATPDGDQSDSPDFDYDQVILDRGARSRARMSARALFIAGAFSLAAAVPMNAADAHGLGLFSPLAIIAYLAVAVAAFVLLRASVDIWRDRRDCARDAFYYGKRVWQGGVTLEDASKTFFVANSMPFVSVFKRNWKIVYPLPTPTYSIDQGLPTVDDGMEDPDAETAAGGI